MSGRLSTNGSAPMSAPLKFADGSAAIPALTFQTNPANGFYKTTGGIGVAIGGVKVAEFLAGGVIGARFLGELIPYTCTAAPALTVMPFGQTLNRITYAALWVQAQIEIAAGNTFYNNGDGSTTFGIGDMRGRIPAAWDKMGGSASGRLTTAGGGVDGTTLGSVGAAQSTTLLTANLPPYTPAGSTSITATSNDSTILKGTVFGQSFGYGTGGSILGAINPLTLTSGVITTTGTGALTGTAQGGTSLPFSAVQPTLVTNYILFAGA